MDTDLIVEVIKSNTEEINYHQNCALRLQPSSKEFCYEIKSILYPSRLLIESIFCLKTGIQDYFCPSGKKHRQFEKNQQKEANKLSWLIGFRDRLNETISHSKLIAESPLICFVNLIDEYSRLIDYLKSEFGFVLLDKFSFLASKTFSEDQVKYFEWVFKAQENLKQDQRSSEFYYVLSRRLIFYEGKKLYEYSLAHESNVSNKFNSLLAYSSKKINRFYRLDVEIIPGYYDFKGNNVRFNFISSANVKFLNRSLQLMADIVDCKLPHGTRFYESHSYFKLMKYLSDNDVSINFIFLYSQEQLKLFFSNVLNEAEEFDAFGCLLFQLWRYVNSNESHWKNVVKYLASSFSKDIIEKCLYNDGFNREIISTKCYRFEKFPFLGHLPNHLSVPIYLETAFGKPRTEIRIFKYVEQESKNEGNIFVDVENILNHFEIDEGDLEGLIGCFNEYCGEENSQWHLSFDESKKHVYIKEIYENELEIFKKLVKPTPNNVDEKLNIDDLDLKKLSNFKQNFLTNELMLGNNYAIYGRQFQ